MRLLSKVTLLAAAVALSACYHAIIDTGRPASDQMIVRPWANSFVYGLVPPPVVETAAQCPNGVSRVETQHSFLNGLVGALTFGIYTPMEIRVTCAGGGAGAMRDVRMIKVGAKATGAEKQAALGKAADIAVETGAPVFVRF